MSNSDTTTGAGRYQHAVEVIHNAATAQGLCSEADSVLESIGLPRRRPTGTFRATWRYEGTASYENVTGQSTEAVKRMLTGTAERAHASAAVRDAARSGADGLAVELVEVTRTDGADDGSFPLPQGMSDDSTEEAWDDWFQATGDALREQLDSRGYRGYRWVNEALDESGFGAFPTQTTHEVTLSVRVKVPAHDEDEAREQVESLGSRSLADRVYSAMYGDADAYEVGDVENTGEPYYVG